MGLLLNMCTWKHDRVGGAALLFTHELTYSPRTFFDGAIIDENKLLHLKSKIHGCQGRVQPGVTHLGLDQELPRSYPPRSYPQGGSYSCTSILFCITTGATLRRLSQDLWFFVVIGVTRLRWVTPVKQFYAFLWSQELPVCGGSLLCGKLACFLWSQELPVCGG